MVSQAASTVLFLVLIAACARDNVEPPGAIVEPTPPATSAAATTSYTPDQTRSTPRPGRKPPTDTPDLVPIYRDELAALGLVLTPRGGLIDRSDGGYERSAAGDHLALYLEPAGDFTMQDYVDGIAEATRVFVPDVFERWPGLASMDVCQEPTGETGELQDPPPVSQIEVTREQVDGIDWGEASVRDLVRAAEGGRLRLNLSDELTDSPEFRRAVD